MTDTVLPCSAIAVGGNVGRLLARAFAPLVLVVLLAGVRSAPAARADGGVDQVVKRIGAYELDVSSSPGPYVPNLSIDVSVLVERYPSGDTVPDATVTVRASPDGGGRSLTFPATHGQATNKVLYGANVRLPVGRWQIAAEVRHGDWSGSASFPLTVGTPPPIPDVAARVWRIAPWVAAALIVAWGMWLSVRVLRGQYR